MARYLYPQFGAIERRALLESRVREVGRAIRELCGQLRSERFDPVACAEAFGVPVSPANLPSGVSGRLSFAGASPRIEYCASHSETRARFTIAHELGHLCFLDKKPVFPKERGDFSNLATAEQREEFLCNRIAAELLMPTTQFRRIASSRPPCPTSMSEMQTRFGVSADALARRIRDLRVWSMGFATVHIADGDNPSVRANSFVVVSRGIRRYQERENIFRRIRNELDRAEASIAQRVRENRRYAIIPSMQETPTMTTDISPYFGPTTAYVRIIALHA